MPILRKFFFHFLLITLLTSCGTRNDLAPVTELKWQPFSKYQKNHIVRRGETLYAIAFRYDTDFRNLAYLNHLRSPYFLRVGQVIKLSRVNSHQWPKVYKPAGRQTSKFSHPPTSNQYHSSRWYWPVNGRVAANFIPQQGKKGINIACVKGEKVHASANGIVAYAGNGLAGYGNLIIIKHNNEYLTAYGNNIRNLVSEGQQVRAGQVIAEVGIIDRKYWGVHFEIRKKGTPVNPLNYLQKG